MINIQWAKYEEKSIVSFISEEWPYKIIEHELPSAHCYVDDTQLYLSFKPNSTSQDQVLQAMENCIEKIWRWMIHDRLLINGSKTELILIGPNNNYLRTA